MIIGKGSIASILNDRMGFIFFAAGVSNSGFDGNDIERNREFVTVKDQVSRGYFFNEMFVYFSTISIYTIDSPYTKHKKEMEETIRRLFKYYTIIRLGNVWECTNPNTFLNKMRYWEMKGKLLDSMIRDEYKFMISKEQLNFITDNLPRTGKNEISIFGEMVLVKDALKR